MCAHSSSQGAVQSSSLKERKVQPDEHAIRPKSGHVTVSPDLRSTPRGYSSPAKASGFMCSQAIEAEVFPVNGLGHLYGHNRLEESTPQRCNGDHGRQA